MQVYPCTYYICSWDEHGPTRYIPYRYWDICRSTMYILYMSLGPPGMDMDLPGTFSAIYPGNEYTRGIAYMSLGLPGMDMYLPGTFHIHPGIYVGLPCTYYICPWDLLGWTWTYQVHS